MIKLYSRRSFNQKLSDTFDFAKENWKPCSVCSRILYFR
jgi:hypothetical protein